MMDRSGLRRPLTARMRPSRRRGGGQPSKGYAVAPVNQHKITLDESEMPTRWYNILHDLPTPPPPPLHPATGQPVGPEDLTPIFPMDLILQEVTTEQYIDIPDEILDVYRLWRPSPLFRAHRLEKALGTPARIYYKYEGVSPAGSHKPNTAVAQAYYNAKAGVKKLTTETGAGQWGTSLAFACAQFGIECEVWQVRASYDGKPYRKMMIETFGGTIHPSPSDLTESGRAVLAEHPDSPGSLGIAISEAVEAAAGNPEANYALGSVLNHVLLHQSIIGEETLLQLAKAGESADVVIGCAGGGSNFGGLITPFLREKLAAGSGPVLRAAEPASCPSLTQGTYAYDFGDVAGLTPMMKMHTLGHDFIPDPIHAGGLRYHGMSPLISHLYEEKHIEADGGPPERHLRGRGALRPDRGDRPGPGVDPRARGDGRGGAPVHRVRRGEGDRRRAVGSRPPRPHGLRRLPARRPHRPRVGRHRAAGVGRGGPGPAAPRRRLTPGL